MVLYELKLKEAQKYLLKRGFGKFSKQKEQ